MISINPPICVSMIQDFINVPQFVRTPDPRWSEIDKSGHVHHWHGDKLLSAKEIKNPNYSRRKEKQAIKSGYPYHVLKIVWVCKACKDVITPRWCTEVEDHRTPGELRATWQQQGVFGGLQVDGITYQVHDTFFAQGKCWMIWQIVSHSPQFGSQYVVAETICVDGEVSNGTENVS